MLYVHTVFARVFLGYDEGVKHPVVDFGRPLYGNILSELEHGRTVVHLWPYDFPLSARQESNVRPLASLWKPEFSVCGQQAFSITGLERCQAGRRARWLAQRWEVEPMTFASIKEALERKDPRYGAIAPAVGIGPEKSAPGP